MRYRLTKNEIHSLIHKINELRTQKGRVIVAIDGNSASGKSSLAAQLKLAFSCNVIPMDDFFLRAAQRTPKRLAEPGGNIDYERFAQEVIHPLITGELFEYKPYDCQKQTLGEPVVINPNPITIIEGVYSLHPRFIQAYDIKVFLHLDEAEQLRRLNERNPQMLDRFINEWIPMENKYFSVLKIQEKCDFVYGRGSP